jgi:hypothetical protein
MIKKTNKKKNNENDNKLEENVEDFQLVLLRVQKTLEVLQFCN